MISAYRKESSAWYDGVPAVAHPTHAASTMAGTPSYQARCRVAYGSFWQALIPTGVSSASSAGRRRYAKPFVASASRRRFALLETSVGIIPIGASSAVKPPLGARQLFLPSPPSPSPPRGRGELRVCTTRSPSPTPRERGQRVRAELRHLKPQSVLYPWKRRLRAHKMQIHPLLPVHYARKYR